MRVLELIERISELLFEVVEVRRRLADSAIPFQILFYGLFP